MKTKFNIKSYKPLPGHVFIKIDRIDAEEQTEGGLFIPKTWTGGHAGGGRVIASAATEGEVMAYTKRKGDTITLPKGTRIQWKIHMHQAFMEDGDDRYMVVDVNDVLFKYSK